MRNKENNIDEHLVIKNSEIPLESSLGLLAYGDVAFTAWRKLKKKAKKED